MIPARSSEGTAHDRHADVDTGSARPVQGPRHCYRSWHTGNAMGPLSCDLDRRDIEIEAGQRLPQGFALCRDKEPMQLLFKSVEVFDGLMSVSTLTQKVLELIHGMSITGQGVTALQCLHGAPLWRRWCV